MGRMAEPEEIFARVPTSCSRGAEPLAGRRVLVTAGGTREPLDAVRFLGNRSSGRMGVALAAEARRRGADVTLLAANLAVRAPAGVEVVETPTAADDAARRSRARDADVVVMAAAVADYRPAERARGQAAEGRRAAGRSSSSRRPTSLRELGARRSATARCSSASRADRGERGPRARAREARRQARRPRRLQRRGARRHRLRLRRERGRADLGATASGASRRRRRSGSPPRSSTRSSGLLGEAMAGVGRRSPPSPRTRSRIVANLGRVVHAPDETLRLVVLCLVAEGHLIVEDFPGVGKTMLAKALARSLDCRFSRLQFTPDLLPSDVTGVNVFDQRTNEFEFRPGPVFANLLLVDEINRASPKTQAALLECMQENQVTVDGVSYQLARAVHGDRDAEPDRVRGHLPAARGAARPLHAAARARLPAARRGGADARPSRRATRRSTTLRAGRRRGGGAARSSRPRSAVYVEESLNRYVVALLRAHPLRRAALPRRQPARRDRAAAGGQGARARGGTRLRRPGRRQGRRRARARAPADPRAGGARGRARPAPSWSARCSSSTPVPRMTSPRPARPRARGRHATSPPGRSARGRCTRSRSGSRSRVAARLASGCALPTRPVRLDRAAARRATHVEGDDVVVDARARARARRPPPGSSTLDERIGGSASADRLTPSAGAPAARYVLERGAARPLPVERRRRVVEDPFGLARASVTARAAGALLVLPALVELDRAVLRGRRRGRGGRRLLLRRPTRLRPPRRARLRRGRIAPARPLALDRAPRPADGQGARGGAARRGRASCSTRGAGGAVRGRGARRGFDRRYATDPTRPAATARGRERRRARRVERDFTAALELLGRRTARTGARSSRSCSARRAAARALELSS